MEQYLSLIHISAAGGGAYGRPRQAPAAAGARRLYGGRARVGSCQAGDRLEESVDIVRNRPAPNVGQRAEQAQNYPHERDRHMNWQIT